MKRENIFVFKLEKGKNYFNQDNFIEFLDKIKVIDLEFNINYRLSVFTIPMNRNHLDCKEYND
jgi:hypothetical protein